MNIKLEITEEEAVVTYFKLPADIIVEVVKNGHVNSYQEC
jgi:hypothetical protein